MPFFFVDLTRSFQQCESSGTSCTRSDFHVLAQNLGEQISVQYLTLLFEGFGGALSLCLFLVFFFEHLILESQQGLNKGLNLQIFNIMD